MLAHMYDQDIRRRAMELLHESGSVNAVSKTLGPSRSTIRSWRDNIGVNSDTNCPRDEPFDPTQAEAYSYLLGVYLGDGCISRVGNRAWFLRLSCDASYPGIINEVARSVRAVRPQGAVYFVHPTGCVVVQNSWRHWPCLFPQHGPGRKHERLIKLEQWQQDIIERLPGHLLRGLFHSDGCRVTNWTVRQLSSGPKRYEYPRYFFSNESADIIGICAWALDLLEIPWRLPRRNALSVARRAAVARLDEHVGPKC